MAASSTALKAAYLTEVNKVRDALVKARATYALDRWIEALDAQNAIENGQITSYSVAGRTITRASLKDGQAAVNMLEQELVSLIYGRDTLLDMNTEVAQPSGTDIR